MRLEPALRYQLSSMKWPVIIFYIVIYTLIILIAAPQILWMRDGAVGSIGGMDLTTMIFLFVVGLNSFKSAFHMFSANGISRKTMFVSLVVASGILCAGMALIDSINDIVFNQFLEYQNLTERLFVARYSGADFMLFGEGFLWKFFTYSVSLIFGYFISTAYYRMNKPLKLIVSVGVPAFLLIILPLADTMLFSGEISKAIGTFISFCLGLSTGSPYVAIASDVVFYAIFATLGFLLMRRATVKLS